MVSAVNVRLSSRQRGDFQTPEELARKVWSTVDAPQFDLIIEPTFGLGAFLTTIPDNCKANIIGWELHDDYYRTTVSKLETQKQRGEIHLFREDVFSASYTNINVPSDSSVLVIGNPPWVTNSEQGSLGGENTGRKYNLKALPGFDAMTGKSNFDISEAIILHFVNILKNNCRLAQFALLTKFSVLRNLMLFLSRYKGIGDFEFHKINTSQYFNATADAGLLQFKVGEGISKEWTCPIYQGIAGEKIAEIRRVNNRLIYNYDAYERTAFMENNSQSKYIWRQGVKHDLSKIMEISESEAGLWNGLKERVDIEEGVLYQLYKSSDIFHGKKSRYVVPIYQRDLKDSLEDLESRFPKLYSYLMGHKADFSARKSSIYKKRPLFSIFGIGDYTHFTYKVAIGGLYAEPVFRLLTPDPRPVVVDDTSYMLATNDYGEAIYLLAILSLDCTREFLLSISHSGDKRRFSKDVLARVLIPPINECPKIIRAGILDQWLSKRSLSAELVRQVQGWLFTNKQTVARAFLPFS